MKRTFREALELVDFNEIVKIKKDLDDGGAEINKVLKEKIREEIKKHDMFCSICNARIDPYSTSNFTLVFGPEDLKKKATFCAIDCLEYFLANLKDLWRANKKSHEHQSAKRGDDCEVQS